LHSFVASSRQSSIDFLGKSVMLPPVLPDVAVFAACFSC
jgi:hypothetical protein